MKAVILTFYLIDRVPILTRNTLSSVVVKTQYPPVMIANPPKQIIFEQGDSVMLPCVADANPSPM